MDELPDRATPRRPLRLGTGVVQVAAWSILLIVVDRPWRELGGLLDERLRWLERFVLGTSLTLGWLGGGTMRDRTPGVPRLRLRCLWLGPSALVAGSLVALQLAGQWPAVLLILAGWLGYCAGLDIACRLEPLLRRDPREGDGPLD